ncbi:MAG TPA: glycosyltransferase [Campylobacterales bacterium]|nr:glycosyltransferase [Campylobacterales bacterium]
MAKFSILMNCYNCEKYLKEAIDSIYNQTYSDWEIIFIDNCSTDSSSEIAKGYDSRLKYFKTSKTIPLGEARQFGLQYCNGEYLAFLDTDDIWLPQKLEKQLEAMEKFPDVQMSYTGVIFIDKFGKKIREYRVTAKSGYIFPHLLKRYEINMQSVVIRNNIDIQFDTTKEYAPDFDLFMKIASKYPVAVIPEPLVKYRKLANSLTNRKMDRWWIETKETLDDIFSSNPELAEKYPQEKKVAYSSVANFKARYLISQNRWREAREELRKAQSGHWKYKILFLLSYVKPLWHLAYYIKDRGVK